MKDMHLSITMILLLVLIQFSLLCLVVCYLIKNCLGLSSSCCMYNSFFLYIFLPISLVSWMGSFYGELDFYELLFWITEDCKWITLSGSLIFMAVNNVLWHIRLLHNVRKYNKYLQIKRKLKINKIWIRLPHNTTTTFWKFHLTHVQNN